MNKLPKLIAIFTCILFSLDSVSFAILVREQDYLPSDNLIETSVDQAYDFLDFQKVEEDLSFQFAEKEEQNKQPGFRQLPTRREQPYEAFEVNERKSFEIEQPARLQKLDEPRYPTHLKLYEPEEKREVIYRGSNEPSRVIAAPEPKRVVEPRRLMQESYQTNPAAQRQEERTYTQQIFSEPEAEPQTVNRPFQRNRPTRSRSFFERQAFQDTLDYSIHENEREKERYFKGILFRAKRLMRENYPEEALKTLNLIFMFDPYHEGAQDLRQTIERKLGRSPSLFRSRPQPKKSIETVLREATIELKEEEIKEDYEQEDYQQVARTASEILQINPENKTAKKYQEKSFEKLQRQNTSQFPSRGMSVLEREQSSYFQRKESAGIPSQSPDLEAFRQAAQLEAQMQTELIQRKHTEKLQQVQQSYEQQQKQQALELKKMRKEALQVKQELLEEKKRMEAERARLKKLKQEEAQELAAREKEQRRDMIEQMKKQSQVSERQEKLQAEEASSRDKRALEFKEQQLKKMKKISPKAKIQEVTQQKSVAAKLEQPLRNEIEALEKAIVGFYDIQNYEQSLRVCLEVLARDPQNEIARKYSIKCRDMLNAKAEKVPVSSGKDVSKEKKKRKGFFASLFGRSSQREKQDESVGREEGLTKEEAQAQAMDDLMRKMKAGHPEVRTPSSLPKEISPKALREKREDQRKRITEDQKITRMNELMIRIDQSLDDGNVHQAEMFLGRLRKEGAKRESYAHFEKRISEIKEERERIQRQQEKLKAEKQAALERLKQKLIAKRTKKEHLVPPLKGNELRAGKGRDTQDLIEYKRKEAKQLTEKAYTEKLRQDFEKKQDYRELRKEEIKDLEDEVKRLIKEGDLLEAEFKLDELAALNPSNLSLFILRSSLKRAQKRADENVKRRVYDNTDVPLKDRVASILRPGQKIEPRYVTTVKKNKQQQMIEVTDEFVDEQIALAYMQVAKHDFEGARETLAEVNEVYPDSRFYYRESKKLEKAIEKEQKKILKEAEKKGISPDEVLPERDVLTREEMKQKLREEAKNKRKAKKAMKQGDKLFKKGLYDQAISRYEEVFLYDPDNVEASESIDKAKEYLILKGNNEWEEEKRRIARETEEKIQEYVEQVEGLIAKNKRVAARAVLQKALLIDPDDPELRRLKKEISAIKYDDEKKADSPKEQLQERKKEKWIDIGIRHYLLANYDEAVEAFENVLKIDPNDEKARNSLDKIKLKSKSLGEAA